MFNGQLQASMIIVDCVKIKYGEFKKSYLNAKPFQAVEARRMHTRSDFGRALFTHWTGNLTIRHVL